MQGVKERQTGAVWSLFTRCHNADAAAAALRDVATRCPPQSTVDAKESAECGPREQVSRWAGEQVSR